MSYVIVISRNISPIIFQQNYFGINIEDEIIYWFHEKNFISARNAGNMIPHAKHFDPKNPCPEPGVLELGQCYQLCELIETI